MVICALAAAVMFMLSACVGDSPVPSPVTTATPTQLAPTPAASAEDKYFIDPHINNAPFGTSAQTDNLDTQALPSLDKIESDWLAQYVDYDEFYLEFSGGLAPRYHVRYAPDSSDSDVHLLAVFTAGTTMQSYETPWKVGPVKSIHVTPTGENQITVDFRLEEKTDFRVKTISVGQYTTVSISIKHQPVSSS